jgi:hypothetical protein
MGRLVAARTECTHPPSYPGFLNHPSSLNDVMLSTWPNAMSACARVSIASSKLALKTRGLNVDDALEPGTMYCSGSIARYLAISLPSACASHAKQ